MSTPSIRKDVSKALDMYIGDDQWNQAIELLDREGKFTRKNMIQMILLLCKSVEHLEEELRDLQFQFESLNVKTTNGT